MPTIKKTRRRYPRPSRHPTPLTPALKDRFFGLLLTWPLRQAQGRVSIRGTPEPKGPAWQLQLEEQYGDQHYADRLTKQENALRVLALEGRADLEAACAAFEAARHEAMWSPGGYHHGHVTDRTRDWKEARDPRVAALRKAVTDLRAWLVHQRYGSPQFFTAETMPEVFRCLDALLLALDRDPFLNRSLGAVRRPRAGHQPEPWKRRLQAALKAARVPKALRRELMIAVGLSPFRE